MTEPVIGIDYWPAVTHGPGIGRHMRELVRAMVRLTEAPPLRLFEVGPLPRSMPESSLGLDAARVSLTRRRASISRRWLGALDAIASVGADRLLGGVDLFQRAFFDQPPVGRGVPQLLPLSELPEEGSLRDRALSLALFEMGDVLVMSRHAQREVARRYGLAPERIHRAVVGCEHWARDLGAHVERDDPPVLLALGAVREGRGHAALLAAFETLRAQGRAARLCIIGRSGDAGAHFARLAADSPFAGDIQWIREPVEADLPRLVARASTLVHLAREELTPVTPLEACALGLSIVASRLPAFEEALAGEALWIDEPVGELDQQKLTETLEAALTSAHYPAAQARRLAIAAQFTWERHARATLSAWRAILARA